VVVAVSDVVVGGGVVVLEDEDRWGVEDVE